MVEALYGTAVTELENSEIDPTKTLVFTTNPCPEYWQDVLDLPVQGLVVNSLDQSTCITALKAISSGELFKRLPPAKDLHLNQSEREVLRLVARSFSNKEIQGITGLADKYVQNNVASPLRKLPEAYPELRFSNRGCLMHYYRVFLYEVCILEISNEEISGCYTYAFI